MQRGCDLLILFEKSQKIEASLHSSAPTEIADSKKPAQGRLFVVSGVQFQIPNMAQRTGLEPATPGVTGRYSNRLNYRCAKRLKRMVGDDGIEPPTFCL